MTMTALATAQLNRPQMQANDWLARHHPELRSRATACFARCDPEAREEAVAEVIASVSAAVHHAARGGRLPRLTPYHCIKYAAKQYRCGRRIAGYSSSDVLSAAAQRRHGVRVASLDQSLDERTGFRLREALADRDTADPAAIVERDHDYPRVLAQPQVSPKARATFAFLAETHGAGSQRELAATLLVSPSRISQLKRTLGATLALHGYAGPLGPRPAMRPQVA